MKITYGNNTYYIKNGFDVYMPNNETVVNASLDDIENGWLTVYKTFSCEKCHKPTTAKHDFNIAKNCMIQCFVDEYICNSCGHPQYHTFSLSVMSI
jgi:hypothetical protein